MQRVTWLIYALIALQRIKHGLSELPNVTIQLVITLLQFTYSARRSRSERVESNQADLRNKGHLQKKAGRIAPCVSI